MTDNPYQSPPPATTSELGSQKYKQVQTAKVFGVLNIVFGVFGVCGLVFGVIGLLGMSYFVNSNPELAAQPQMQMLQSPTYQAVVIVSQVIGAVQTIILIIAGIGLLQFLPYGRTMSNLYGVVAIIGAVVGIGMQIYLASNLQIDTTDPAARSGMIGGIVGGAIGGLIALVYPAIVLFFVNRHGFKTHIMAQG